MAHTAPCLQRKSYVSLKPDETIGGRIWRRDQRLTQLGYSDYKSYINSPLWRAFRAAYRKSERPQNCQLCAAERGDAVIVLHHVTYERIGQELLDDVTPLCAECHGMVHQMERDYDELSIADFAFLCDEARAKRHRLEAAARRRELDTERVAERRLRLVKQLNNVIEGAGRSGFDPTRHLAYIDRRLTQLEREVKRAALKRAA